MYFLIFFLSPDRTGLRIWLSMNCKACQDSAGVKKKGQNLDTGKKFYIRDGVTPKVTPKICLEKVKKKLFDNRSFYILVY